MRGRERVPAVVGPRCRSRHVTAMCCHDKSGMPESLSLSFSLSLPLALLLRAVSTGSRSLVTRRLPNRLAPFFPLQEQPSRDIPYCHAILIARAAASILEMGNRNYGPISSWITRTCASSDINAGMRPYLRNQTWFGQQTRPLPLDATEKIAWFAYRNRVRRMWFLIIRLFHCSSRTTNTEVRGLAGR